MKRHKERKEKEGERQREEERDLCESSVLGG